MAVQVAVVAVGAALAALSQLAGNLTKGADEIGETYPEPGPVEQEIAKLQLEYARALREKIDDPQVVDMIYSQLPETKMSAEDRAAFTEEYIGIKKQIISMGTEQINSAMGQNMDSLVSRGVLSQEAADKQKIKNEAAINAVTSIWNKKLDASRMGMARHQYLQNAKTGLGNASVIADVDSRNRQIYNSVISKALSNMNRRQGAQSAFENTKANANTQNAMFNADVLNSFNQTIVGNMIPYGQDSGGGGGGGMDMSSFMSMFSGGGGGAAAGG